MIDRVKLRKSATKTIVKKDPIKIDKHGIWTTAETIKTYMNYQVKSKHVFAFIKLHNIPSKKSGRKTIYLLNAYLDCVHK